MYCRNCGYEVSIEAIACPNCGVPPMKGKHFCYNCKATTHEDAVICVRCGVGFSNRPKINTDVLISTWGKWSYSNYIIILLFSLLPFINVTCNEKRFEKLSGLNLAVGVEREFPKENTYTNAYGYQRHYTSTEKETIFVAEVCLFYILMIACLVLLLTSLKRKFAVARILTLIGLISLGEWFIISSIKINKITHPLIDISHGAGFWLTILITIASIILLSIYIKLNKSIGGIVLTNAGMEPELQNQTTRAEDQQHLRKNSQVEELKESAIYTSETEEYKEININHDSTLDYQLIEEQERNRKLRSRMVMSFSLLGIIITGLIIWFFAKDRNDEAMTTSNPDSTSFRNTEQSTPNESGNNSTFVAPSNQDYQVPTSENKQEELYNESTNGNQITVEKEDIDDTISIASDKLSEENDLLEKNEKDQDFEKLPAVSNRAKNNENVLSSNKDKAQQTEASKEKLNSKAVFPGGEKALQTYLKGKVIFPKNFQRSGAWRTFKITVDETGKIVNSKFLSWDSFDPLNIEGLRVITNMPIWQPAIVDGQPTLSVIELTIFFDPKLTFQ